MAIPAPDLDNRFDLHPATETTGPVMDELRAAHKALARQVLELVPPGREQSLALTQLEQALFWSNAGVARANTERPPF